MAPATKRGVHFPLPPGRFYGFSSPLAHQSTSPLKLFYHTGGLHYLKAALHSLCPLSEATKPLAPRADRPDGYHIPLYAKGVGPCGNTGKPRPADWYLARDDSLLACTEILRFAQDDGCPAGLPDPRSRSPIPAAPRLRATTPLNPQVSGPFHRLRGPPPP